MRGRFPCRYMKLEADSGRDVAALYDLPPSSLGALTGERTIDLTSVLARPAAAAVSRSRAPTIPRAGSSPSKQSNILAETVG